MGIILDAKGKSEPAIDVYRQILSIYDSIQNAPEDDRGNTYCNMAAAYEQLEKFGDSLDYYKKQKISGKKHFRKIVCGLWKFINAGVSVL